MDIDFDAELTELEKVAYFFSSNAEGSFSVEELCGILKNDNQDTSETLEEIYNFFGAYTQITFVQIERVVRERILLVEQLKKENAVGW